MFITRFIYCYLSEGGMNRERALKWCWWGSSHGCDLSNHDDFVAAGSGQLSVYGGRTAYTSRWGSCC